MAIDSENVAASAAAMMMRSCAVAAATPSTTPRTLTRPSWPPRMMSRNDRPIPFFSSSASCSGPGWRRSSGCGWAMGGFCLAASATTVDDEVGIAHHELVFIRDMVQHRHHVVALDVQGRTAPVADQVVMIGAFFGEL